MNLNSGSDVSVFIFIKDWIVNNLMKPHYIIIAFLVLLVFLILNRQISQKFDVIVDWFKCRIKKPFTRKIIICIIKCIASPLFTAFITCVCPYLIDKYNSKINIFVGIWITGIFLNVLSTSFINKKNKTSKLYLSALEHMRNIQNRTATKIYDTRENMPTIIKSIVRYNGVGKTLNDHYFKFEDAAKIACDAIYKIIQVSTGSTQHQVTIYKRYQNLKGKTCPHSCPLKNSCTYFGQKKEWTKMIACSNYEEQDSLSFNQEHCFNYYAIPQNGMNQTKKKKHFYIHFFTDNKTEIEVITGGENIEKCFLFHDSTKSREEKIKQYIAIPLFYEENNTGSSLSANLDSPIRNQQHTTFAVIQIDFQEEWLLGKSENEIKTITNTAFSGIISYLQTSLQVEELTKNMLSNISVISNLSKQTTLERSKEYDRLEREYNEIVTENNILKLECDLLKADIDESKTKKEKKNVSLNKKFRIKL